MHPKPLVWMQARHRRGWSAPRIGADAERRHEKPARGDVEMADRLQKPGETPVKPGEYEERGPRGGKVPNPRQYTIERGDDPLPPTQKSGRTFKRVGPPKP